MLSHVKVDLIEPVMVRGLPDEMTFKSLDRLADTIVEKHKGITIV
jgi:hypothetical protein